MLYLAGGIFGTKVQFLTGLTIVSLIITTGIPVTGHKMICCTLSFLLVFYAGFCRRFVF